MKYCLDCVNLRRVTRQINYDDGGKCTYRECFCAGSEYFGYLLEDLPEVCSDYIARLEGREVGLVKYGRRKK